MSRLYNILNKLIDIVISLRDTVTSIDDYVIEKGATEGWSYRKWKSGKVEAWRYHEESAGTFSTWVDPIKYKDITISMPSGIFATTPRIFLVSRNNQIWVVNSWASSVTSISARLATLASGSITSYLTIYATNY